MLLYLFLFFAFFAFVFALPDLVSAARELPAGSELTQEERDVARQVGRNALRGRIPLALGAAAVVTGLAIWRRALPGLR